MACLFAVGLKSQTTVTLSPASDAAIGYHDGANTAGNNYGTAPQLAAFAIPATAQPGGLNVNRGLIKFDLSSIPGNAIISDAKLDLYAYGPIGTYNGHTGSGSGNSFYLERVTTAWNETTVTWNNQPTTNLLSYVSLPGTTMPTQDYLNTDVTGLIQNMFSSFNNGFLLRLAGENATNIIAFCSKDHPDPSKRPKLRVTYDTPTGISEAPGTHPLISCFPNPAKDEVSLYLSSPVTGPVKISICNPLGQIIKDQSFENAGADKFTMDISNLDRGLYYFFLTSGTDHLSGKFIAE